MRRVLLRLQCGVLLAAWNICGLLVLKAETPSLAPPGVPRSVEALLDVPLRDTAICRAPGGGYYLTGTMATVREDGSADFQNNDGVWLWKSADLKTWDAIGQVWSIRRDPSRFGSPHFNNPSMWQGSWRASHKPGEASPVRGITAPELHFVKGNWRIAYSMNSWGTGLLTSESGKPEGPYKDSGRITGFGGDASLFEDEDGVVYWVWGEGWIAKMKDDLTGLAEKPRLLEVEPEVEGGSWPHRIGTGGAFLFKASVEGWEHGSYHLVGCETVGRMGSVSCVDTFIASAPSVYGPYKRRDVMVPHGGQATVFQGPDNRFYATFSGIDEWAAVRDRPALVPLEPHAKVFGEDYWWGGAFVKPWYPVTETGAWSTMKPFVTERTLRDIAVLNAPDGFYYMSCTDMELNRKGRRAPRERIGVEVWRSKDLEDWEPIGVVWKVDDYELTRAALDKTIEMDRFGPILYDIELHHLKDTYWIVGSMQGASHWAAPGGTILLILRSRSGKIEGPYEFVWNDQHTGDLWTPSILEDDDGTVYIVGGGVGNKVARLKDDLSGLASEIREINPEGNYSVGEGGHLLKIGGKYIHTSAVWHGADPYDKGMSLRGRWFSTYDLMYFTADNLDGPWSETRCAAPKCGNARPFQDKNGNWYAPFFGNHFFGPWRELPGMYPLTVREENRDVFIEPTK